LATTLDIFNKEISLPLSTVFTSFPMLASNFSAYAKFVSPPASNKPAIKVENFLFIMNKIK